MEVSDKQIRSMRWHGVPVAEIARRAGTTPDAIEERVRQIWTISQGRGEPAYVDPNEHLIQLEASAIRLRWTPDEERRRRGCITHGWAPPDASADVCRVMEDRCGAPSRRSSRSRLK